jgi:AmmeMemoRadiSam system protein B
LDVDVVVIISPSHHRYPAPLLSTGHTHFETPLGQVAVATDIVDQLERELTLLRVTNDPEHAIEVELPFLQRTLDEFQLVPLAMIDQSWTAAELLGNLLASLLKNRKVLLVASSDLSHFYTQAEANQLDQVILDAVGAYDPHEVVQADEAERGFACGRGAIAAVMVAAQALGADSATVVDYATSGDVSGDFSKVVGYGAAIFH